MDKLKILVAVPQPLRDGILGARDLERMQALGNLTPTQFDRKGVFPLGLV